jgi:hypothetical protein
VLKELAMKLGQVLKENFGCRSRLGMLQNQLIE